MSQIFDIVEELEKERKKNKELEDRIDKALRKLNASKNHFKTQKENNTVIFTIKILKGE